jgi:hypothetical protein
MRFSFAYLLAGIAACGTHHDVPDQPPPDGGVVDGDSGVAPSPIASVHGVFDVRDHGAVGDGTADDTKALRDTIDAAHAAGGGIVYVPSGHYRIKGGLKLPATVSLAGVGFAMPAMTGTWIVVDESYTVGTAIELDGGGATVRDLGVFHEQGTPGAGWRPRAFGWAIDMKVPDTLVRHVYLANPTFGIHGIGRTTIENVAGEPLAVGIQIDGAYDVVRLRNIRFDWTADGAPVWSTEPSVRAALGTAIDSLRNDNPEIYDVKVAGYQTGLHFGASAAGVTSKFALMDTYVNDATNGVVIDGANTTGKIDRMWLLRCASVGITVPGANSVVSAADLDIRQVGANGVRVDGAGAFFLVDQVGVTGFDSGNAGFPALEAASATATVKVGLYHSLTGGSIQTGGVGHMLVDGAATSSTFDLRIPTPTEVPEARPFPFGAKTDVLAHGALGDGVHDDAPAIQQALDASMPGDAVVVPAGAYRLGAGIHVPSGVSLVGVGWQGQGMPVDGNTGRVASHAFAGSYFYIEATSVGDAVTLADHAAIEGIGMYWDQGAIAAGWQPRDFGFGVKIAGGDSIARDIFLLNATRGIAVTAASGPVTVDHVFGSPQTIGLMLDTDADVRANDLHFWPFWGGGGAYGQIVAPWVENHATAFLSRHSVGAEVSNAFSIFYQYGVELAANAANKPSTDFRLWNADQDIGVRGYVISGAGTTATFANFSAQGDTGAIAGVTGIWVAASAAYTTLHAYNGDLRLFTGNATRNDSGASDIRVNLTRFEGWNRSGAGFPADEGAAVGPQMWQNGL